MKQHSIFQTIIHRGFITIPLILALLATTLMIDSPDSQASSFSFIVLTKYKKTLNIRQSFYLVGISSSGKRITWRSSNSRIASVNTYGLVTAKKAGKCRITAKVKGAEASCTITVRKTTISLSAGTVSMENGSAFTLRGSTSNGSEITWKSSRRSVATVDENGKIEAFKPGETVITASADGSRKTCRVTVKKPKVKLNHSSAVLCPKQTLKLTARVSSGRRPVWKSRKSSVASVDENGLVTARKRGTAIITAAVDGIRKECEITVK